MKPVKMIAAVKKISRDILFLNESGMLKYQIEKLGDTIRSVLDYDDVSICKTDDFKNSSQLRFLRQAESQDVDSTETDSDASVKISDLAAILFSGNDRARIIAASSEIVVYRLELVSKPAQSDLGIAGTAKVPCNYLALWIKLPYTADFTIVLRRVRDVTRSDIWGAFEELGAAYEEISRYIGSIEQAALWYNFNQKAANKQALPLQIIKNAKRVLADDGVIGINYYRVVDNDQSGLFSFLQASTERMKNPSDVFYFGPKEHSFSKYLIEQNINFTYRTIQSAIKNKILSYKGVKQFNISNVKNCYIGGSVVPSNKIGVAAGCVVFWMKYSNKTSINNVSVAISECAKTLSVHASDNDDTLTYNGMLKNIFNTTNCCVFIKDADRKFIYCNLEFSRFTKLPFDGILGLSDELIFSRDAADRYRADDIEVLSGKEVNKYERSVDSKGESRYVRVCKRRIEVDGKPYILGVFIEIPFDEVVNGFFQNNYGVAFWTYESLVDNKRPKSREYQQTGDLNRPAVLVSGASNPTHSIRANLDEDTDTDSKLKVFANGLMYNIFKLDKDASPDWRAEVRSKIHAEDLALYDKIIEKSDSFSSSASDEAHILRLVDKLGFVEHIVLNIEKVVKSGRTHYFGYAKSIDSEVASSYVLSVNQKLERHAFFVYSTQHQVASAFARVVNYLTLACESMTTGQESTFIKNALLDSRRIYDIFKFLGLDSGRDRVAFKADYVDPVDLSVELNKLKKYHFSVKLPSGHLAGNASRFKIYCVKSHFEMILKNVFDNARDAVGRDGVVSLALEYLERRVPSSSEIRGGGGCALFYDFILTLTCMDCLIPDSVYLNLGTIGVTSKGDGHGLGIAVCNYLLSFYDGVLSHENIRGAVDRVVVRLSIPAVQKIGA